MAEGVSGEKNEANGASRLDLPHLTRRELLSHRAKLERAIARGRSTEAGTALLARIEAADVYGAGDGDAVLVRPDRFIAARWHRANGAAIRSAITRICAGGLQEDGE